MNYTFRKINTIQVIDIVGEIDLSNAMELKNSIKKKLSGKNEILILNLEKTTYIDSSGLGCIIAAKKHLAENKGELAIACPTPDVKCTFELIDLQRIIDIYDSLDQALKYVKNQS